MNRFAILFVICIVILIGIVYWSRGLFKNSLGSKTSSGGFTILHVSPSPGVNSLPQSGILPATGL